MAMDPAEMVALDAAPEPAEKATLLVLDEAFNPDTGQLELAVCASKEKHVPGGQCAYCLGRRGFKPRFLAVLDPETSEPVLDDAGREFVQSNDPRSEAHVPAVRVPEPLPNLRRHALRRLASEAADVVTAQRAKENG